MTKTALGAEEPDKPKDNPVTVSYVMQNHTAGTTNAAVFNNTGMSFIGTPLVHNRLFGTWLKDTLELQRDYYNRDLPNLKGEERKREVTVQAYAAEDEIHEATAEVSWKPWAKSDFLNREAYIGELVDALHFIANMLCIADCTDDELNAAYFEKMERNRQRQREGYTGLNKCEGCRRAVDDIQRHGGHVSVEVSLDGGTKYLCDSCEGMQ